MSDRAVHGISEMPEVRGKRVMVRASLDVPIEDGVVQNDFRVRHAIPTISYLLERGAKVIILTHVGRDPKNTTLPLVASLKKYIEVTHVGAVTGVLVEEAIAGMKDGTAILLENVRGTEAEENNDLEFGATLASYADFYVNDAFAVSHRAHASIVGIPVHIPGFAGITFLKEYTELGKALAPEHPSLFILGGAKYETKAPLIEAYAHTYTHSFIGGALANDFLKGRGYEVGESLVSDVDLAGNEILNQKNIHVPIDVVAVKGDASREVVSEGVAVDEKILDVGTKTVEMLAPYIRDAKTILWNGPMGHYESHDAGTKAIAKLIAESDAFSVVGGGDTVAAIESLGLGEKFGFLSTAGGAMLEFLEKKTLPGIESLKRG